MELMNWLCPECGLELHKHVIDIGCPVSDSGVASPTFEITASNPAASLTGTLSDGATEAQIVTGGETIIITLSDDPWVTATIPATALTGASQGEDPTDWVGMLKAQIRRLEKRIKELESRTVLQCPHCAELPTAATKFRRTCPKCETTSRKSQAADKAEATDSAMP